MPEDFGFMHDIVLQQDGRVFTQVGFSIDMTVEISPKSGPVGTPIAVEVSGIGWRPLVNSWNLLYDNNFTGWISSVTTHGSASFAIPATGEPGVHILEVLHGELTFPYRNMPQSPGAGPAALGDPVHRHGRRASDATAARTAGAEKSASTAAARRSRGDAAIFRRRRAGRGARRRFGAGQELSAQLDSRRSATG